MGAQSKMHAPEERMRSFSRMEDQGVGISRVKYKLQLEKPRNQDVDDQC
jgi:hypothetical protein